jgi:hypothetical protein
LFYGDDAWQGGALQARRHLSQSPTVMVYWTYQGQAAGGMSSLFSWALAGVTWQDLCQSESFGIFLRTRGNHGLRKI